MQITPPSIKNFAITHRGRHAHPTAFSYLRRNFSACFFIECVDGRIAASEVNIPSVTVGAEV
jgi:hypothetical protein